MSAKPISLKLIYNRIDQLNDKGEALLQIRATKDRKSKYLSTGIYLKPDQWNLTKEEVIKHSDKINLNHRIKDLFAELRTLEREGSHLDTGYSVDELMRDYGSKDKVNKTSFTAFALAYLEANKPKAKATYTKHKTNLTKFQEYGEGNVNFNELTHPFIDRFFME